MGGEGSLSGVEPQPDGAQYTHGSAVRKTRVSRERMLVPMRIVPIVLGALVALAGAVWIAQGLNLPFAPRSFMTRDLTWTLIGVVALVAGLALVAWGWRRPTH